MISATSFVFDGISSEDYDIMIYYIGDPGVVEDHLWETSIDETRINSRYDPHHFGMNINRAVTRQVTFGSKNYIEREDVERIADWLTSHNTYKWLEIDQDDMTEWRYKAIISNLQLVNVNGLPFAFICDVTLDSQFAYERPSTSSFEIVGGKVKSPTGIISDYATITNSSAYDGYIYPKMTIRLAPGTTHFSMENESDISRPFVINVPDDYVINDGGDQIIFQVDNKNQIITTNCDNINIFDCFKDEAGNHYFFRLAKGDNKIVFTGDGMVVIECEFLRKVGM
ncbi:hypothetical protein M2140_000160 [Clostridiales Family XIII bacterium PM5-7]